MDEIVKAALKKWPNVPDCYDWLALDARGDWYMRDDRIQQTGPFPQVKGSLINHDKLKAFIQRNYAVDEQGCWFFQNGPQRVYVTLEATPWVYGIRQTAERAFEIQTHTDQRVTQVKAVFTDEHGRLFLETGLGVGVVRSPDMVVAAEAIDVMAWQVDECEFATLPARYGYVLCPAPAFKV
jgi:hypothetical protein